MTNLGALNERLQSKMEQDRRALEQNAKNELEILSNSLNVISKNALHTIEADIQQQCQEITSKCSEILNRIEHSVLTLDKRLARAWIRTLVVGTGMTLGIALGTWGISTMLSNQLVNLQSQITTLKEDKTTAEQSLTMLHRKTWGISLLENKQGRFLVLNSSHTLTPGWVVGNQSAWKVE